jgi:YesN/AraC family two-component response regulator
MPFGLCNVLATFQKVVTKTFKEYLNKLRMYFWMILMYLEVKRTTYKNAWNNIDKMA